MYNNCIQTNTKGYIARIVCKFYFFFSFFFLVEPVLQITSICILSVTGYDESITRGRKLDAQWAKPVSLTFHSALRKLNAEPSICASHQISVHFGKAVSGKKIFRNQPL